MAILQPNPAESLALSEVATFFEQPSTTARLSGFPRGGGIVPTVSNAETGVAAYPTTGGIAIENVGTRVFARRAEQYAWPTSGDLTVEGMTGFTYNGSGGGQGGAGIGGTFTNNSGNNISLVNARLDINITVDSFRSGDPSVTLRSYVRLRPSFGTTFFTPAVTATPGNPTVTLTQQNAGNPNVWNNNADMSITLFEQNAASTADDTPFTFTVNWVRLRFNGTQQFAPEATITTPAGLAIHNLNYNAGNIPVFPNWNFKNINIPNRANLNLTEWPNTGQLFLMIDSLQQSPSDIATALGINPNDFDASGDSVNLNTPVELRVSGHSSLQGGVTTLEEPWQASYQVTNISRPAGPIRDTIAFQLDTTTRNNNIGTPPDISIGSEVYPTMIDIRPINQNISTRGDLLRLSSFRNADDGDG